MRKAQGAATRVVCGLLQSVIHWPSPPSHRLFWWIRRETGCSLSKWMWQFRQVKGEFIPAVRFMLRMGSLTPPQRGCPTCPLTWQGAMVTPNHVWSHDHRVMPMTSPSDNCRVPPRSSGSSKHALIYSVTKSHQTSGLHPYKLVVDPIFFFMWFTYVPVFSQLFPIYFHLDQRRV